MKTKQKINQIICLMACLLAVSCSTDKKNNDPVALTTKDKTAYDVSLASIPDGSVAVSWAEKDTNSRESHSFYFARWEENKSVFSSPVSVPLEGNTSFNP